MLMMDWNRGDWEVLYTPPVSSHCPCLLPVFGPAVPITEPVSFSMQKQKRQLLFHDSPFAGQEVDSGVSAVLLENRASVHGGAKRR